MAQPKIDIGILTIRADEFRAVLSAFPDEAGVHSGRREYTLRYADAGAGVQYVVAILRQVEQGNGEAQDAARDLLDDLAPSLLLVVGIAGGLPSDDVTLGDVVLATRIHDYNVQARKTNAKPAYNLAGGPITKRLAGRIANLHGRTKDLGPWTEGLPNKPAVSWSQAGELYGPKGWQSDLKEKLEAQFGEAATLRQPAFVDGPIATSDTLVKDPKLLFPWIETARGLLAVEMESGGVYRAARDRCPMLPIRGISDIVGLRRSNAWTKYACTSAAAFARAFLRTRPTTPRSSSSSGGRAPRSPASLSGPEKRHLFPFRLDDLPHPFLDRDQRVLDVLLVSGPTRYDLEIEESRFEQRRRGFRDKALGCEVVLGDSAHNLALASEILRVLSFEAGRMNASIRAEKGRTHLSYTEVDTTVLARHNVILLPCGDVNPFIPLALKEFEEKFGVLPPVHHEPYGTSESIRSEVTGERYEKGREDQWAGYILLVPNPWNVKKAMLFCGGNKGIGTQAALVGVLAKLRGQQPLRNKNGFPARIVRLASVGASRVRFVE